MAAYANRFGPQAPDDTYLDRGHEERLFDAGEVTLNYVAVGEPSLPALLLIPGQTESWWGYADALPRLAEHFQTFAVDLRGQGRSSRAPGRYTLDLIGNDLVRFIDGVIGRPTIVAGLSSGGVVTAWLSAYARPGQVAAAYYEDPPLFSSEIAPAYGQGIRQAIGPIFALMAKYLGDQWSIGDWEGMAAAIPTELPDWMGLLAGAFGMGGPEGPPQALKEYDPEWGRAFWTGTFYGTCDHERMLRAVKVPVLFTHHFRMVHEPTGALMGAISDLQVDQVRRLVTDAGQDFEYRSFPEMPHPMHSADPGRYVDTLVEWARTLPGGVS
jgi:pimeloyl-ACP methyl ester carboxylesterase